MGKSINELYADFQLRRTAGPDGASPSARLTAQRTDKLQKLMDGFRASAPEREARKKKREEEQRQRVQRAIQERDAIRGIDLDSFANGAVKNYNRIMSGDWDERDLDILQTQLGNLRSNYSRVDNYYKTYRDILGADNPYSSVGDMLAQMESGLDSLRNGRTQIPNVDAKGNELAGPAWNPTATEYKAYQQNAAAAWDNYYAEHPEAGWANTYRGKTSGELEAEIRRLTETGVKRRELDTGADAEQISQREAELAAEKARARSAYELILQDQQLGIKVDPRRVEELRRAASNADVAYDAFVRYPHVEEQTNQGEIDWLRNYIDSGNASYYAAADRYGVDFDTMTPSALLRWRDEQEDEDARGFADDYIRHEVQRLSMVDEDEYRETAAAEAFYTQLVSQLTPEARKAFDEAVLYNEQTNKGLDMSEQANEALGRYETLTGTSYAEAQKQLDQATVWKEHQTLQYNLERAREGAQGWKGVGSSVATVLTAPATNLMGALDVAGAKLSGQPVRSTDLGISQTMVNQAVRGERAQVWGETAEKLGLDEKTGQWWYNTIMSGADSAVNMLITQGLLGSLAPTTKAGKWAVQNLVSNAIMGSGAAVDTYIRAKQEGMRDGQALLKSALAGAIEGVTEAVGGEIVWKDIVGDKTAMRALVQSFLSEGTEEVASNVLNRWVSNGLKAWTAKHYGEDQKYEADLLTAAIMGVLGKFQAMGYSDMDAFLAAFAEVLEEDASSFLAGGVSALMMTGGGRVIRAGSNAVQDYRSGRQMIREGYRTADNLRAINNDLAGTGVRGVNERSGAYALGRGERLATEARTETATSRALREMTEAVNDEMDVQRDRAVPADRNSETRQALSRAVAKQVLAVGMQGERMNSATAEMLALTEAEQKLLKGATGQYMLQRVLSGANGVATTEAVAGVLQDSRLNLRSGNETRSAESAKTQQTATGAAETERVYDNASVEMAVAEAREDGVVSRELAERLLEDPAAVAELREKGGLELSEDMRQADKLSAVKYAVDRMSQDAQQREAVAEKAKEVESFIDRNGVGEDFAQVLRAGYDGTADAAEYLRDMNQIYRAGEARQIDTDPTAWERTAQEVQARGVLNIEQINAAYEAGENVTLAAEARETGTDSSASPQNDTGRETRETERSSAFDVAESGDSGYTVLDRTDNGEESDHGEGEASGEAGSADLRVRESGKWDAGESADGQIGRLEESAGRAAGRNSGIPSGSRAENALRFGKTVTAQQLGIEDGSGSVRLLTGGETEDIREARRIAEKNGLEIILFSGSGLISRGLHVRGLYQGNRIFVQVDDREFSAAQIARHEAGHARVANQEISVAAAKEAVRTLLSDEAQIIYAAYEDIYEGTGYTEDEIWAEILCDSLGRMNTLSEYSIYREAVEKLQQTMNEIIDSGMAVPQEDANARSYEGKSLSADGDVYSYDFLTGRPDMSVIHLPLLSELLHGSTQFEKKDIVNYGMENARSAGTERAGKVYVRNNYTGRDLRIDNGSIRHGLDGNKTRLLTNARLGAVIGEVVKNGIPINAIKTTATGVAGTYAMVAYAQDDNGREFVTVVTVEQRTGAVNGLEVYDVAHSLNARERKTDRSATKAQGVNPTTVGTISIADLLQIVKQTHQSILSADVLQHFEEARNTNGYYADKALFSASPVSLEALRAENEAVRSELKEMRETARELGYENQRLRDEQKEQRTIRAEDAEKVARRLLKQYGSTADFREVSDAVKETADAILQTGSMTTEEYTARVETAAVNAARLLVQNAQELTDPSGGENFYTGLRGYLRDQRLYIPVSLRSDITAEDWNEFRKKHWGTLRLSSSSVGAIGVDTAYQELQEQYGESYFPADITHPGDQLKRILELLQTFKPVYQNPFSAYMAEAIEYTKDQIITDLMAGLAAKSSERGYLRTNRAASDRVKQLESRLQRQEDASRKALERERERRRQRVEEIHQSYADEAERRRNEREEADMRGYLLRLSDRARRLAKKSPKEIKQAINALIGDLDTAARSMSRKTIESLQDLEDWYNELKKDPDWIPDQRTEEAISRLHKRHIADLSLGEVEGLINALRNIEKQIRDRKRTIDTEDRREVAIQAAESIDDIKQSEGAPATGVAGAWNKLAAMEVLSPERAVRRIVGYNDDSPLMKLAKDLSRGQRDAMDYEMRARARFTRWINDKEFTERIAGKNAEKITIEGIGPEGPTTVEITPAMRISLYLHAKNSQNLRHIAGGGITVPDAELYRKGNSEAWARGTKIRITPSQIRLVASRMSTEEKAFADAVEAYFNTMSRDAINEVSNKLLGYDLAGIEGYFPINTDSDFTKKDFEAIKYDGTLEGMGFLKERINSAAPVMLEDVTSVLDRSIKQHAKYAGLAIPVRNMNKVLGFNRTHFDESGMRISYDTSMLKTIRQKWGDAAVDYVEKLMTDLQNGKGGERSVWGQLLSRSRSRYAGAVLSLNAGVAAKQAASYPTAAAVIGAKPLIRALGSLEKVDTELIAKYTPLLWYRSLGFSNQELGDIASRGQSLPKFLNWIQGMDIATTRRLWLAAEMYVRQEQSGLERGSEAYYQATAEVYNRIIEETQPNYTTMQRPQLLRSQNELTKVLNMFKTQPFQNMNLIMDALGELRARGRALQNEGTAQAREAYLASRKKAARVIGSQLFSSFFFAAIQYVWDAFRGKRKKYEDEEGELTLLSWMKAMGLNMLQNGAGMLPFGGELLELLETAVDKISTGLGGEAVFDATYYGMGDSVVDTVNSFGEGVLDALSTCAQLMGSDDPNWENAGRKLLRDSGKITQVLGIPVNNVKNMVEAVAVNLFKLGRRGDVGRYYALRITTDPASDRKSYYDLLYHALKTETESYDEILALMERDGSFKADEIPKQMKSRMKEDYAAGRITETEATVWLCKYMGMNLTATGGDSIRYLLDSWAQGSDFSMKTYWDSAWEKGGAEAAQKAVETVKDRYGYSRLEDGGDRVKASLRDWCKKRYAEADSPSARQAVKRFMVASGFWTEEEALKLFERWNESQEEAGEADAEQAAAEAEARRELLG